MPIKKKSTGSVRPIRALMRGLDALQALNKTNGATVTDVARAVGLPRTTAYRVLETLCAAGYGIRDEIDEQYRLTTRVRSLSEGYDDESWVGEIAKPLFTKLANDVVWPLAISTLSGMSMLVRETTDRNSPLALERYSAGIRVPLLASASGRVYLAFCSNTQRAVLLDSLEQSDTPENKVARDRDMVNKIILEVQKRGFSVFDTPSWPEISIAVPLYVNEVVIGGVVMRYIRSAMSPQQAIDKHVLFLHKMASEIGKAALEARTAQI